MTDFVSPFRVDILDRVALETAISSLTPMQREIVYLYYWEDMSFDEIGKIIGPKYRKKELTGSAVRYYHKKILKVLLPLLQEED